MLGDVVTHCKTLYSADINVELLVVTHRLHLQHDGPQVEDIVSRLQALEVQLPISS